MGDLGASLLTAARMIMHMDPTMVRIIVLTFEVNVVAVVLGASPRSRWARPSRCRGFPVASSWSRRSTSA